MCNIFILLYTKQMTTSGLFIFRRELYVLTKTQILLLNCKIYSQGFDLRIDHFHCFSTHGQGGHYHWDTTPADVLYRAYFVLAEYIYRIDQPPETTPLARQISFYVYMNIVLILIGFYILWKRETIEQLLLSNNAYYL